MPRAVRIAVGTMVRPSRRNKVPVVTRFTHPGLPAGGFEDTAMTPKQFGGSKNCRKPSGQSLIVALIALVFLTALMGTVTVDLLTEARFSEQQHDRLTAFYLARAGIEAAVESTSHRTAEPPQRAARQQANEQEVAETRLGAGYYKASYSDEERKVNINKADADTLQNLDPAFTEEIVKADRGTQGEASLHLGGGTGRTAGRKRELPDGAHGERERRTGEPPDRVERCEGYLLKVLFDYRVGLSRG